MEILKEPLGVLNCLNKEAKLNKLETFFKYLNQIFLCLFLISLFFSPTATAIFFILGIIAWLISFKNRQSISLNALDKILILQFIFSFIFYFLHSQAQGNLTVLFKDNLRFYLPWFWFRFSFENNYKIKRLSQFAFSGAAFIISVIVFLQALGIPIGKYYLRLSGFHGQPYTTSGLLLIGFFINLSLVQVFSRLKLKNPLLTLIGKGSAKLSAPVKGTPQGGGFPKLKRRIDLSSSGSLYFKLLTITLICQFFALVLISQRAIWLALIAGIAFYIVFNLKKIPPKISLGFSFTAVLALVMAYFFSYKFKAKLQSFFHLSQDKAGLGCRMAVWKLNWQSFLKQPLIGQGQAIKYKCLTDELGHAHNIFLQQLVVNGLLGFFVWFSFWLAAFYKLAQKFKTNLPIIAALMALLIEGLFENWYGDSEVQTAFFFLLASAL